MIKSNKLKTCVCLVVTLIIAGTVVFLVKHMQQQEMEVDSIISVSDYPTTIEFLEISVYSHSIVYYSDRNEIMYTLTNTSENWYEFGQIQRAFKLIDNEWFHISGSVGVLLVPYRISPNSSVSRSHSLNGFESLRDRTMPAGVYLFKKPLNLIICHISWDIDRHNPMWLHLILEVPPS